MGKTNPKTVVVCDAGPIIHLDEVGCLYLMKDFAKVVVPVGVRREVLNHRKILFENSDGPWFVVPPSLPLDDPVQTLCKVFSLDVGEVEALSILRNEPESVFLTDDAAARLVATKLGFRVHGTIGVLVRAIRREWMTPKEVVAALYRIPSESTLHIKPSLLEEVISTVEQEYGQ